MLRDKYPTPETKVFLGRTLFGSPEKTYNRVEPLAEASSNGWRIIKARHQEFPSEGKVFTYDPRYAKKEDQYVLFTTIQNERDGADRLLIDEICEPYEILVDFSNLSKSDQRNIAINNGLLRGSQSIDRLILPIDDARYVFPKIDYNENLGRWLISNQEQLSDINVYSYSKNEIGASVSFNGRYFALPAKISKETIGFINWDTEAECLGAALNLLRKTEDIRAGGDLFGLSKQTILRLQQIYSQSEMLESGNLRLAALFDRINEILPDIKDSHEYVDKFANQITANKVIRDRFNKIMEELKAKTIDEFRNTERKKIYSNIKTEIPELIQQKEKLLGEICDLEKEINNKKQEFLILKEDRAVKKNESIVLENTGKQQDDVNLANSRECSAVPDEDEILEFTEDEKIKNYHVVDKIHQTIEKASKISLATIAENLENISRRAKLPLDKLAYLDIALRSGELLTIAGGGARRLLEAYAIAATSGEILCVELSPNILDIDDIWWKNSTKIETVFSYLWKMAIRHPDNTYIVLFLGSDCLLNPYFLSSMRRVFRREKPANLLCALLGKQEVCLEQNNNNEQNYNDITELKLEIDLTIELANSIIIDHQLLNIPRTALSFECSKALNQNDLTDLLGSTIDKRWISSEHIHQFLNIARAAIPWKLTADKLITISEQLSTQAKTQFNKPG